MKFAAYLGAISSAAVLTHGFLYHSLILNGNANKRCQNSTVRMSTEQEKEPQVYVVSEITEENKKNKFQATFDDQGVLDHEQTKAPADSRAGPLNYDGLIDGDAFDGGDGQVGCVGDGTNALETFDERSTSKVQGATMVTQSKDRQMNAWGSSTGYADQLKEQGMVDVDRFGEDKLKVKRQQLENWRNQQELQRAQRAQIQQLEQLENDDPDQSLQWKRGSSHSYMDALAGKKVKEEESKWNEFKAPQAIAKAEGITWSEVKLTGRERIIEVVTCVSRSGRPGIATIQAKSRVMTFEPFHCQFVGDSEGFSVDPQTGTLNRRGGEPIPINVSFQSKGPGDARDTKLVIQTEEDKYVYQIEGRTE